MDATDQAFWERAEHEMRIHQNTTWFMSMLLLRGGILAVLFTATYLLMVNLLDPAKGYFFNSAERMVHPIFWSLVGIGMIIVGAYIRFQALGPIVERLKED